MIKVKSAEIITPSLSEGAILNQEYIGFKEDYLVLHCLLKMHKPKTFLEIGTNMGTGTNIICNALGKDAKVFSLDLPPEQAHISLQHPISEGIGHNIGKNCQSPFIQILCNSMNFEYSTIYPIEGWFIDGEHNYENPLHESREAINSQAKIIIWHDSDIPEVYQAICDAFIRTRDYELYRVEDTRMAFAIRK